MRIEVTQRHIDVGRFADHYNCPIALALKEKQFRSGEFHNDVDVGTIYARIDGETWLIPKLGQKWVHEFDRQEEVQPIVLDLHKVNYTLRRWSPKTSHYK